MKTASVLICAFEQIATQKSRSLLTILGIVIAVTSTIVVVSVVRGFTDYVSEFLQGLGTNAMWVWPQRPPGEAGKQLGRVEMDLRDYEAVQAFCSSLRGVSPLIPNATARVRAPNGGETDELALTTEGVAPVYHAIRNMPVELGRTFSLVDIEQAHQVCVMGREAMRKLQLRDDDLGGTLLIQNRRFRIIGILKEKGSFLGSSQDNVILIPYTVALKLDPSALRRVVLTARCETAELVPEARAQIVNVLRRRHGLQADQPNDFEIRTQDEILQAFTTMSAAATALLAGIVGISLLVGGIGIMNVMLVSVTERTREIGLRKAVGARRRDILTQFLVESATLSLVGGGLGIALGYGLSVLASLHPQMVEVIVPWWAVALGFGVSAGTGLVFGMVPAIKAALLNPIDALRHE